LTVFATIVLEDYGDRGKALDDLGRDHLRRIVCCQSADELDDRHAAEPVPHDKPRIGQRRVDLSQIARELADDLRDDMRLREPARSIEFVIAAGLKAGR
jgi:hypothetical protein